MEALYNWPYYYRAVEEAADTIVLAHPLKTRIIGEAKIKTDKIDSRVLAYMLKARYASCCICTQKGYLGK